MYKKQTIKPALKTAIANIVDCFRKGKISIALGFTKKYFRYNGPGERSEAFDTILDALSAEMPEKISALTATLKQAADAGTVDYFANNRPGKYAATQNAAQAEQYRSKLVDVVAPPAFENGQVVESRVSGQRGIIKGCLNGKYPERILKQGRIWILETSKGRALVKECDLFLVTYQNPAKPELA